MKLSEALRAVEARYDAAKYWQELFTCGICRALYEFEVSYERTDKLLREVQAGFRGGSLRVYPRSLRDWQDRAIMCLLMAHWLEDKEVESRFAKRI